jgi:hypothetical protein
MLVYALVYTLCPRRRNRAGFVGRGSWVVGRGSWFVGRGLWCVVRGSWFVVRGSWDVVRGSCYQPVGLNSEYRLLAVEFWE